MEVKICGVCRPQDAAAARVAGADYVGVILSARSARLRSPDEAVRIYAAAAGLRRVGVFVDAPPELVVTLAERLALDVVQLHGAEPPDAVAEIMDAGNWVVWKAIRPREPLEVEHAIASYAGVSHGLLLDGRSDSAEGGAGVRFPWREMAAALGNIPATHRLIVAGGLDAGNVAGAIALLAPDVVDVSSGVEHRVGEKDVGRIAAFIRAARATPARTG